MTTDTHVYDGYPTNFNWGAFLYTPLFLLVYGRVGTALLVIFGGGAFSAILSAAGVAPLGWLVSICISAYFGNEANDIAWATGRFANGEALRKSMRRWNIAAACFVILIVVLVALAALTD